MRINPNVSLDHNSSIPLFLQLSAEIEGRILKGIITPGQMLPSSREYARTLLLSRGTVVRAYEILTTKGFLRSKKGKGLTASRPASAQEASGDVGMQRLDLVSWAEAAKVEPDAFKFEQESALAVEDVTKAAVPSNLLPVKRWRELLVKHCGQIGRTYQIDPLGSIDLRRAVSRFLTVTHGVVCAPEQISVYTNTDQALDTIARLLVRPNDAVVVEEPGYIGVSKIFAAAGGRIFACGIDDFGMSVESLKKLPERPSVLYTTPISQDPTGVLMTESRQLALIDWAKSKECFIVEDSWDTDFWHGRPSAPCVQQKAPEQVIYLYSFWKLLFPLSNACFLVVPPQLTPQLRHLRAMINRPPISLELLALADIVRGGEVEALTAKLQKSYRKRRQALVYSLTLAFGKEVEIATTSGGTHILLRFNFDVDKAQVLEQATACGLKMISMDDYYFDGRATHQYVVYFTNVSISSIGEQVAMFKKQLVAARNTVIDAS
jgi:GntR family transcriptional regulator/MocR family aminotransferase